MFIGFGGYSPGIQSNQVKMIQVVPIIMALEGDRVEQPLHSQKKRF